MDIEKLLRKNILNLKPYSSARDEFKGNASVYLDANENPYNTAYNRYPDPLQKKLKTAIAEIKQVDAGNIFLGNGSDEPIDLLIRAFCEPGIHNMVSISPTYGMYQVSADINNIAVRNVTLTDDFQLDSHKLLQACDQNTRLVFLCSPNNPTSNSLAKKEILQVIANFEGVVVLDEAYIDFSKEKSFLAELDNFPNLVILQTFSKAWGMAGIRLGMAFASVRITNVLNKIKYPYNLNILTQEKAFELLKNQHIVNEWVTTILKEREKLNTALLELPSVKKVFPSDANFLLVETVNARHIYEYLVQRGIIVRDRSKVELCNGCLRITVGTPDENLILLNSLKNYPL